MAAAAYAERWTSWGESVVRKGQTSEPQNARLAPDQMRSAIPRLKSRIAELRAVNVGDIQERGDPALAALRQKIDTTLSDIFGPDTMEYWQFGQVTLDEAPIVMGEPMPLHVVRQGFAEGIARTIASLETVVALFEEKIGAGQEDPGARARRALVDLDLHPEVARAAAKLFENGHYANAVEDSCKALDLLVKLRSGRSDLGGTELMQAVFSPKNPVLRFSELQTESERNEQLGLMFLYAGAMLALRNPRAHGLIQDDPESALEYIAFVSLLAKTLDRATRV